MKAQTKGKLIRCAAGIAVIAPSACAAAYGVLPFGGGIFIGCLAAGVPVWAILPVYAGIGIAAAPTLAHIIEITVSALIGSLACVPALRRPRFLFPLYVLSETGRVFGLIFGDPVGRTLIAVALGAAALLFVLAATKQTSFREAGMYGVIIVCSVGLHTVPIAGAVVAGIVAVCLARAKGDVLAVVAYAAGALIAIRAFDVSMLYVLSAFGAVSVRRNRWTAACGALALCAVGCALFGVDGVTGIAFAGGALGGLCLPVPSLVRRMPQTTAMLPVLRKMTVAKEALKSARVLLEKSETDASELAVALGAKLCDGCGCAQSCRIEASTFEAAGARALAKGRSGLDMIPDVVIEQCSRAAQIPKLLDELLRAAAREAELDSIRFAAASLASSQLNAFSALVDAWVCEAKTPVIADAEWCDETRLCLAEKGGELISMIQAGAGVQIVAKNTREEDVIAAVNAPKRKRLTLDSATRIDGGTEYYLLPEPALGVVYGAAQNSKHEACGDAYFVKKINAVTVLAVLCDGMGSGRAAAALSERTMSLIEACFAAGFDTAHVLYFVNALLSLSGERFSCVDLCLVDLVERTASFVKAGGVESYVVGADGVTVIEGGALPLGADGTVHPVLSTVSIAAGDLIYLVTDGITDSIELAPTRMSNPQTAADELVKRALAADNGSPHDDMTALVLRTVG